MDEQEIAKKKILTDSLLIMCILLVLLLGVGVVTYLQKIRLGNQEKQMALYQGQEQERNFIARELHDDVGSTLAGIKTQLPSSIPNFPLLSRHLDYVYQKIKTLSHTLYAEQIEQVGLPQACQDFINLIDRQGIITFSVYGKEALLPAFEATMIYRIIQELLTNTVRHAQASQVYFNLYFGASYIQIGIEDNGKGMKSSQSVGIGLANIQKRVDLLSGKIEINTGSEGTTFLIWIPFDKFLVKTLNGN